MHKFRHLALGAFFVAALAFGVSACGGGVPGNSVATVGDQTIKRSTFDHWMRIISISQAAQTNPNAAKTAVVPDAPDFEKCVAAKKKTAAKPAKGQPEPTAAQFKTQCKQQYDQFKSEVLGFLIRSTWLDQEADKLKVKLPQSQVQKEIDDIKKQQFAQQGSYEKFLQQAGLTNEDVLFQQRVRDLQTKITAQVTKGKDRVSDAQIAAYYDKHKDQFATQERRDVRIVLTKTKERAQAAKAALESGQPWKSVAKSFSVDQASKNKGGLLQGGVTKGSQEKALDTAMFAAGKGKLTGPVKTQFGWYVFEVTKITKGTQQTLEESKANIKQLLQSQNQQNALKKFGDDYRKRYKKTTDCRKGYEVDDCNNAPKKKPASTVPGQGGGEQPQNTTTTQP
ncbi:MAG TPA: peptidyl-prolyl cis-trans isomerase [Solirubrobacteraceae bacterium]